jgi:hypothetical protein
MSLKIRKAHVMRANNKSSTNGDQSILHPNHYFIYGLLNLALKLLVTSLVLSKDSMDIESMFQILLRSLENKTIDP